MQVLSMSNANTKSSKICHDGALLYNDETILYVVKVTSSEHLDMLGVRGRR